SARSPSQPSGQGGSRGAVRGDHAGAGPSRRARTGHDLDRKSRDQHRGSPDNSLQRGRTWSASPDDRRARAGREGLRCSPRSRLRNTDQRIVTSDITKEMNFFIDKVSYRSIAFSSSPLDPLRGRTPEKALRLFIYFTLSRFIYGSMNRLSEIPTYAFGAQSMWRHGDRSMGR